ncbi:MAG TPA: hypothetical protein PLD73_16375 [Candidatus Hydrogenedentes bacterium]|nr:hypothetical protein [Candidatus Hydrogenedentota bacterium]
MALQAKIDSHKRFWRGEGPSLILIPSGAQALYDTADYIERFHDPAKMYASEVRRAEGEVDWPTDGIATIRPNLGVIFVPAMVGQTYKLSEAAMPWPGERLDRERIRASRKIDVAQTDIMRKAAAFYELHKHSSHTNLAAYQADTQGVFDIAHMLYGDDIFLDLADPEQQEWVAELLDLCEELYVRASGHLKTLLGESPGEMIHGHGTNQGVAFSDVGVRISEDSCTLISAEMIEQRIMPHIASACAAFGGQAFMHFCGCHEGFLEILMRAKWVRAIDLGNPEAYDLDRILSLCAQTDTVYYGRVTALPSEDWKAYTHRVGTRVRQIGARLILRPTVLPESREEAAGMLELWHKLTG